MIKTYIERLSKFLGRYPTLVHIFLVLWNGFMVSWATKTAVPLSDLGVPFNMNASYCVAYVQAHLHISTHTVVVLGFVLNMVVYYINWRKRRTAQIAEEAKKVAVQSHALAIEAKDVAKHAAITDNKQTGE